MRTAAALESRLAETAGAIAAATTAAANPPTINAFLLLTTLSLLVGACL
jgi:hypothetical protein